MLYYKYNPETGEYTGLVESAQPVANATIEPPGEETKLYQIRFTNGRWVSTLRETVEIVDGQWRPKEGFLDNGTEIVPVPPEETPEETPDVP